MILGLFLVAGWAVLRLMACERCGAPFSTAGALYRAVTFEDQRCRRCRAIPQEERWGTKS